MTTDQFWIHLEDLPYNYGECIAALESRLEKVDPSELLEFDRLIWTYSKDAYDWKLWRAAYIILGGCSDTSFHNFRLDVISLGRDAYEKAMINPDTLAQYPDEAFCGKENLKLVAEKVFNYLTGDWIDEIPGLNREIQLGENLIKVPVENYEPKGERSNLDDPSESEALYPEIWARWGGESYQQSFKDSVVDFVLEYNEKNGKGGAAAANKKFEVNPISINYWLRQRNDSQ